MIEKLKAWLSQFDYRPETHHHLNSMSERHRSTETQIKIVGYSSIPFFLLMSIWLFLKYGIHLPNDIELVKGHNYFWILTLAILILLFISVYSAVLYMFSVYTPVQVYKDRNLLLRALSELSELNVKADDKFITLALDYWYESQTLNIKILPSGQLSEEKQETLPAKLQEFLIANSRYAKNKQTYRNMSDPVFSTGEILLSFTPPLSRNEIRGTNYELSD